MYIYATVCNVYVSLCIYICNCLYCVYYIYLVFVGFIGISNMNHTDYMSVIIHALVHVIPLRDYFLQYHTDVHDSSSAGSALVRKFGEVCRKIWSKYNFKSIISPHELINEISVLSKKRYLYICVQMERTVYLIFVW